MFRAIFDWFVNREVERRIAERKARDVMPFRKHSSAFKNKSIPCGDSNYPYNTMYVEIPIDGSSSGHHSGYGGESSHHSSCDSSSSSFGGGSDCGGHH